MSTHTYVVVLLHGRNPYDGEGGLRVVHVEPTGNPEADAETAVRKAHPNPPSTTRVQHAWVHRLADPYTPIMVPADVPKPEWGEPRAQR